MSRYALLSVSDKTGVEKLGAALVAMGIIVFSTGGTAKALRAVGVPVTDVSDYTKFPEMMDGRVKTLHPKVHGGFLAKLDDPEHVLAMTEYGIVPIDVVVVNLYPFEKTIAKPGVTHDEAIEQIDIGGPAMVRSAAKNYKRVWVVVDPSGYDELVAGLKSSDDAANLEARKRLAAKAFSLTSRYDAAIEKYLSGC
jgi:phosphoribosylaminoimidazolecarboxamide formyltransferase / IMP cyclohydrolase